MEDTNVEEESSVAAYGLVALCDQTFENQVVDCTQFSEEIVETTGDHHIVTTALHTGKLLFKTTHDPLPPHGSFYLV